MGAEVAIPLGSLILGAAMVVFAALTFKGQRDDIRQKAEVTYVQALEGRLASCEAREANVQEQLANCNRRETLLREELNALRVELIAALYRGDEPPPSALRRRANRPPPKDEEKDSG